MGKFTQRTVQDKTIESNDIEPMKSKSAPQWHYCHACEDWSFMPIEDFLATGHYTKNKVESLDSKSKDHHLVFGGLLTVNTPKPRLH